MSRRGLMVILDGLGDRPCPALDGRTPLAAADTPALDATCRRGRCGLVDPLARGVVVGTQTGVGALLGVEPHSLATLPRGPIEAAGAGLPLVEGDVALRANLATVREVGGGLEIVDRRAGRIAEGVAGLLASLEGLVIDGVQVDCRQATQHRVVVRLRGEGLSAAISDTDPTGGPLPAPVAVCRAVTEDARAHRTAAVVNRLLWDAMARLAGHPINVERIARGLLPATGLITRGAGGPLAMRGRAITLGLRAAVVAGEATVIGLARLLGYTALTADGFTAMPETDLAGKVAAAERALTSHDLVFLHIKGPDILAHDRDPVGKRDMLERIDRALVPLLEREDLSIVVTGDHTTDSGTGEHSGEPVPTLLAGPGVSAGHCPQFADGCRGKLGELTSAALFDVLCESIGAPSPPTR